MNEAWSVAVPLKVDASLRYRLGERWQLIAGVNYMYMDPKFNITTSITTSGDNSGNDGEPNLNATSSSTTTITTRTMHEVISAIGLHAGIGINF